MYCLTCRSEYINGFNYCTNCESQPDFELKSNAQSSKYYIVKTYSDRMTAELEQSILLNLGIRSHLSDSWSIHRTFGLNNFASFGLMVSKKDLEKANEILASSDFKVEDESINTNADYVDELKGDPPGDQLIDAHLQAKWDKDWEQVETLEKQMLSEFDKDPDVVYYLAGIRERNNQSEESEQLYERALSLRPTDHDFRYVVAVNCLRKKQLARASKLLSFMQSPGLDQDLEILNELAEGYQEERNHYEAMKYYQIIVRDFPEIAATDRKFRRAVYKIEKHLNYTETILPKKRYLLDEKILLGFVIILIFLISLYVFSEVI